MFFWTYSMIYFVFYQVNIKSKSVLVNVPFPLNSLCSNPVEVKW